jgi:hypothetical protein
MEENLNQNSIEWIKILPLFRGKTDHFIYNLDYKDCQDYKLKKEDSNPWTTRLFRYKCEIIPKKISLEEGHTVCKYPSSTKEGFLCCGRINFIAGYERYLKFEFDSSVSAPTVEMSPEKECE